MSRRKALRSVCALVLMKLLLQGCASAPLSRATTAYEQGQYQQALTELGEPEDIASQDRLLYWANRGLVEHTLGDYQASIRSFAQAQAWLDEHDIVRVSGEVGSLLVNDKLRDYLGEYAERLWLHTYQIMNFLLLDQRESAAVEARRALKRMDSNADILRQDGFTQALLVLAFDSAGFRDEACVQMRRFLEDYQAGHVSLDDDALSAWLHPCPFLYDQVPESVAKASKQWLRSADSQSRKMAEAIVLVSSGSYPKKFASEFFHPPDIRLSFPAYRAVEATRVPVVSGRDSVSISANLVGLANASLSDRGAKTAVRQAARVIAKHNLADKIEDSSETAALLATLVFFVTEQADVRGWDTLPGRLTVLRVPIPPSADSTLLSIGGNTVEIPPLQAGEQVVRRLHL